MIPKWSNSPLGDFFQYLSARNNESVLLFPFCLEDFRGDDSLTCSRVLVHEDLDGRKMLCGADFGCGVCCCCCCVNCRSILVLSNCKITSVLKLLASILGFFAAPQATILTFTSKMCCLCIPMLCFVLLLNRWRG